MNARILTLLSIVTLTLGCGGGGGGGGSSNDALLAADDVAMTQEATAVAIDVLANDADPDEDALAIVAFTNGSNGTAAIAADGRMTYVPNAGFTGSDSFTYELSDGRESATATVTITVTPTADFEETAEPNDGTAMGPIALPATNGGVVVVGGCIDPHVGAGEPEADLDPWEVTVTEPAVLEASAAGFGGLSAGYIMIGEGAIDALNWTRFGIDFDGASSSRQIFLPVAGSYYLLMADSRNLLAGGAAGSADACYATSFARVPATAPLAGTIGTPMTVPAGDVPAFVDVTPPSSGLTLLIEHSIDGDPSSVRSSILALRNGVPEEYDETGAFAVAALDSSDTLRLVIEPSYDFTLTPREVTLDVTIVP